MSLSFSLSEINIDDILTGKNKDATIKLIKKLRDLMLDYDPIYTIGKLVYIKSAKEYGFIIGPMAMGTDMTNVISSIFCDDVKEKTELDRILVVTFGKQDERARVRYSKKEDIQFLDNSDDKNDVSVASSDIGLFCNNQCIFECSEDCIFWKYHKKRN